jgi:hypothetical protein
MGEQRDYGRTAAVAFLAVVVPVGICLTVYWTVVASFPEVTLGGWLLICAYLLTVFAVPTAVTPFLSRTIDLERYTFGRAWRVTAFFWVATTAIAGLFAWPAIGPYIKPFFMGSAGAL